MKDNYNKSWLDITLLFFSGKTFVTLLPGLALASIYTASLVYLDLEFFEHKARVSTFIYSLVGIVLGLLLVFRTNTSYDRWWEGRRLLGNMLNHSRTLAFKLNAYLPASHQHDKEQLARLIVNFAFALKEHLRHGVKAEELEEVPGYAPELWLHAKHIPNRIASLIYEKINLLHQKHLFNADQFILLDKQLEMFADVTGGCERIKNTPIPQAYRVHLIKFIMLFILILPFGFIHEMKFWAIPIVMLIFYAFVGLDFIADEIEDPFGNDRNDLQVDAICQLIRANVYEILGVAPPLSSPGQDYQVLVSNEIF